MLVRMTSDLHSHLILASKLISVVVSLCTDDEECRFGVVLFQCIQNHICILRRTVIVCDRAQFLFCSRIRDAAGVEVDVCTLTGVDPACRKVTVITEVIALAFDRLPTAHELCAVAVHVPPAGIVDIPSDIGVRRIGYRLLNCGIIRICLRILVLCFFHSVA